MHLEELLDLRFRDLDIAFLPKERPRFVGSALSAFEEELRRVRFEMPCVHWYSTEWFCAEGHAGFAIPFYFLHPQLLQLERQQMHSAEGAGPRTFLKYLRHEYAHALSHAFHLWTKTPLAELFGDPKAPYPRLVFLRPYRRGFVGNLLRGYGQAHPEEDFAETAAVWIARQGRRPPHLDPVARRKWEGLNEILRSLQRRRPKHPNFSRVQPLEGNSQTLRDHYQRRRRREGLEAMSCDRRLQNVFSKGEKGTAASVFLRRESKRLLMKIRSQSGKRVGPRYVAEQHLRLWIQRLTELEKQKNLVVPCDATLRQAVRSHLVKELTQVARVPLPIHL